VQYATVKYLVFVYACRGHFFSMKCHQSSNHSLYLYGENETTECDVLQVFQAI